MNTQQTSNRKMNTPETDIQPSPNEHVCRASGTVAFTRPADNETPGGSRRDWVRGFAGIDPGMRTVEIRRELELQTRSALEDQFGRVDLRGVSVDYVTDRSDPPAWIGDGGAISLHYAERAPLVKMTAHEPGGIRDLIEHDRRGGQHVFFDLLEPVICNSGLAFVPPEEAGLTSNPFILSDEIDRTDGGEYRNLGRLIYFEPYQTTSPVDRLATEGEITLNIKA